MKHSKISVFILSSLCSIGFADWKEYKISGNACNEKNVTQIQNGQNLSILFSSFGIHMPDGEQGDGTRTQKTCVFQIRLAHPPGYFVSRFVQVYTGGIIKSANSEAQLKIKYRIGEAESDARPLIWPKEVVIHPEDANSTFTQVFDDKVTSDKGDKGCSKETRYSLQLAFTGMRKNIAGDFLLGGLDSIDAEFVHTVRVIPEWKPCRKEWAQH